MLIRRSVVVTAAILALIGVSACGSNSDGGGEEKGSGNPAKASEGRSESTPDNSAEKGGGGQPLAEVKEGGLALLIESAVRDSGGFVTISGKVTNNGSKSWIGADWKSDERELQGNGGSLAGASLVDPDGKKKYLVLRDTSGRCLCTKFSGLLSQGDSASWFAQFPAPPAESTKVDFQVGTMPPATIEISEG
ncbi:hypothetical protein EES47_04330 [Streptomyces sp. ADI98-12]|uniref:hypothetical protein n=1 Tax=Streptomyces TaxID=1883 RepID=UPI000FBE7341|nr:MULTISPECIES: hypothetical protein [Streptomyces]RPK91955.1 hypothetical protein EES47_04330 [Streptomyces sp. ADI98-12]